jgi:hypothetical protein
MAGPVSSIRGFISSPSCPHDPEQVGGHNYSFSPCCIPCFSCKSEDIKLTEMLDCSEAADKQAMAPILTSEPMAPRGRLVFGVGLGALLFVPVFKALTGLPPYLGILLGLGALWLLTDTIHYGEPERQRLKVPQALSRIDTQGVLFFLGILLSVGRCVDLLPATCDQVHDLL